MALDTSCKSTLLTTSKDSAISFSLTTIDPSARWSARLYATSFAFTRRDLFATIESMSRGLQIALLILGAIIFVLVLLFSSGTTQVADEAVQYELKAIGQSIYEYHETTGQWPRNINDLGHTSLPLRVRYWKPSLEGG